MDKIRFVEVKLQNTPKTHQGTEFECREGKASEPQVGNEVLKSDIEGTRCNGNGRDDE